ncbi:MAG: hypothetical protein WD425_15660 [Nitrospirales bacterium]
MSILRQDPTTKDWVIIAADRGQRPDTFQKTVEESDLPTHDPACPFCPNTILPEDAAVHMKTFLP